MKKYIKIISLTILAILLISGFFLYTFQSYKFKIKSDEQYKELIVKTSNNPSYTVDNLKPLVGPYELEEFIKSNDNNPGIYTPSVENRAKGIFQANFHAHTTNSDGKYALQEYLDEANKYAKSIAPKRYYIAVTDHNNMDSPKQIIDILEKNPHKYDNLKIVVGMEVFSKMKRKIGFVKDRIDIHIVSLAINPYDKELNQIFEKKDKSDKLNYSHRTFESAIWLLHKKGLVGVAHPATYVTKDNTYNLKRYYKLLFLEYKILSPNNLNFTEAYYQSYTDEEYPEIIEWLKSYTKKIGLYRSGSIDNHIKDLFKKL